MLQRILIKQSEFIEGCYTDTYTIEGDTYDQDLIDEEIELMEKEKENEND